MFGSESLKRNDHHQVSEAVPLRMAKSWPWDSQIAVNKIYLVYFIIKKYILYPVFWVTIERQLNMQLTREAQDILANQFLDHS